MPEAVPSPDDKPSPRLGSYRLVQALGSGGMSNVFRAVHEDSGSIVAVKVLPRTLAKNVMLLQRFIREAKSAEALDHPNIAAIYDRGFDQGRHYLVLEHVEGRDLHDRVRLNGALAPDEAVRFIREVAEGLRYAADQGMIHRDVKPANLLMTPDGHAKIIDLGLALQTDDEDERVTRDGTTVGTVDYMAPEQARDSRQTSERSDIYSLGCTFYYLLTGSPPFPGGGLADKLARHYKAPIPDVREHRGDVSEGLSLLIRKMMEKKPEQRYANYSQLIAALDSLSSSSVTSQAGGALDALIVDDDDDDEIGLAPTEPSIGRGRGDRPDRPPSTRDQYLMAEIVDDDEDEDVGPALLPAPSPRKTPSSSSQSRRPGSGEAASRRDSSPPAEISLADLAALDVDEGAANRRPSRRSSAETPTFKPGGSSTSTRLAKPPLDAMLEDDEPVQGTGGPARRGSGGDVPLKTWIAAGVLVGLSLAIVGFGASMVISMMKPEKPPEVAARPVEEAEPVGPSRPVSPTPNRATKPNRPPVVPKPVVPTKPAPAPVKVVVEPPAVEEVYSSTWESKLFPIGAEKAVPVADRPKVVLRRVLEAGDVPQTSSLAAALSRANDLVEIADNGPFFEDDCQVAGRSRVIRAKGGLRPIIKIDATTNDIIKDQVAKFIMGGSKIDHLVLEGLDIALDVRDLPDHQKSLFLCQGADLTLRDCSLTVYNANDPARANRFSLIRVEDGAKPNRIVLERTIIRGPIRTMLDVAAPKVEIVFDRSLIVGDSGPLIALESSERASRVLYFHRSLVATRGVILEFSGRSTPPLVRSLGSTFARVDGGNVSTPFASKAAFVGEPGAGLDWAGEDNMFVGWSGWLTSGTEGTIRVRDLDGVRSAWPGSDGSSEESQAAWPASILRDEVIPADFAKLAPDRRGTLIRIATPHPKLKELTIATLAPLPTPKLSASLIPPAPLPTVPAPGGGPSGLMPKAAILPPPDPNATGPRLKKAAPKGATPKAAVPTGPLNLTFNVKDAPWMGDLGQFLAEKLVEGTTRATIQVVGGGVHATGAIRLPDGLSIAILGASNEGSTVPMPTFFPKPEAAGRALIELHKGDLAIANLSFSSENATRPKHWVLVEDSLLAIRHCRFRDPGASSTSVGASIAFVARGTAPIPARVGPFVSGTNRPTAKLKNCLIWSGGDAISAEVGRGVVDLENCLILSGGPAVSLLPQKVDRAKFEADLILDRCSIAVDRTSLLLGPWEGDLAGPARPWLVSTRRCVFPKPQAGAGALLQVDSDAMARGSVFWNSISDAYEVSHFLASSGPPPSSVPPTDLKKQWIDIWGSHHTRGDQGPNPRRNDPIIRFKERPKPGRYVPGVFEIDPKLQKDMGVDFKVLPPAPKA